MVQEQPEQGREGAQPGGWGGDAPTQAMGAVPPGSDPWHRPAEPSPAAERQPDGRQRPAEQPAQQQPPPQAPHPGAPQPQPAQQAGQQPWQASGTTVTLPQTPVLVRVAQLAAPVLLLIALVLPLDASMPLRGHTLWALWALAGAVVQALPALGAGGSVDRRWTLAAVGTGALALYWLLVTLPSVATSGGFLVTLATAGAVAGVLLSPGRRL